MMIDGLADSEDAVVSLPQKPELNCPHVVRVEFWSWGGLLQLTGMAAFIGVLVYVWYRWPPSNLTEEATNAILLELLVWLGIGGLVAIVLIIAGGIAGTRVYCGNCHNPVANKHVRLCPTCGAGLETELSNYSNTGETHMASSNTQSESAAVASSTASDVSRMMAAQVQFKSVGVAALLTLFFGGLGMMYTSIGLGLLCLFSELILIIITLITFGVGIVILIPFHILMVIVSIAMISGHNKRLLRRAIG